MDEDWEDQPPEDPIPLPVAEPARQRIHPKEKRLTSRPTTEQRNRYGSFNSNAVRYQSKRRKHNNRRNQFLWDWGYQLPHHRN